MFFEIIRRNFSRNMKLKTKFYFENTKKNLSNALKKSFCSKAENLRSKQNKYLATEVKNLGIIDNFSTFLLAAQL